MTALDAVTDLLDEMVAAVMDASCDLADRDPGRQAWDECRRDMETALEAVLASAWLAAHDKALRASIAAEIEARMGRDFDYDDGMEDAARIARGEA